MLTLLDCARPAPPNGAEAPAVAERISPPVPLAGDIERLMRALRETPEPHVLEVVLRCPDAQSAELLLAHLQVVAVMYDATLDVAGLFPARTFDAPAAPEPVPPHGGASL